MDKGIYYHMAQGTHTLKLVGELRFIDSPPLGSMIDALKGQEQIQGLEIDLEKTDYLDSTLLGMIGELGFLCMTKGAKKPILYCDNQDIKKMIETMGLNQVFELSGASCPVKDLKVLSCEEPVELKAQVIRAHEMLIKIDPKNKGEFEDLLHQLKSKGLESDE